MARTVLGAVGAVIGGIYGGAQGAQLGWFIGSTVGGIVDPQVIKGPSLGDLPVQTAQDGMFLPFGYGKWITTGNILDRSEPRIVIQEEQQGKGGPVVESERLLMDYAIRICESIDGTASKVIGVTRVWENEQLVYDVTPGSTITRESAKWLEGVTFYLGDQTQLPSATLEAIHGVGNVPAYRGRCYAEFRNQDLTDKGKAIPQYRFEVVTEATVTPAASWLVSGGSGAGGELKRAPLDMSSWTDMGAQTMRGWLWPVGEFVYNTSGGSALRFSSNKGASWTTFSSPVGVSTNGGWLTRHASYLYLSCGIASDMARFAVGAPVGTAIGGSSYARSTSSVSVGGRLVNASVYSFNASYSQDGGATWSPYDGELTPTFGGASIFMATDGADVCAMALFDDGRIKIRRSNNRGSSWSTVYSFPSTGQDSGFILRLSNGGYVAGASGGEYAFATSSTSWAASSNPPTSAVLQFAEGNGIVVAACLDGSVWKSTDFGDTWSPTASTGLPLANGIVFVGAQLDTIAPGTIDLASIILDLADRCGVQDSRLDVTELTDLVRGYAVRNEYSAAGIMRPLQRAFFFDSYDADGKTWFPKRGGDVVLMLTEADLVDDPEFDDDTRNQEVEYPQTLHLMYDDPDNAQAPADQPSTRTSPDVRVRGSMTVEVPITFTADEAAQVADRLHKIAFTDLKGKVRFPIPASYARLTPSDCIALDYEGRVRRLAIEKRVLSDEVLQLTCRHERQSNYTSNVTGYPSRPPLPPTPTYPGETDFVWMNLPVLDDTEDALGWHCAVAGSEEGWAGARVDMSSDEGATYTPQVTVTRGAVIGVLLAPLGDASPYVTDMQNELRLSLIGPADVLESASRAQCLRGANGIAIVKADGTCEIVQYQDVTEESENVWVCTTLLRGRKNTGAQAHATGARTVLLTGAEFVPSAASLIGTDLWLRATSVGNSPDDSEEFIRTWSPAVSQTEWAPTYLRLSRSGNDLSATWSPRHRLGAARYPVASTNFQGYRVTLTKGANTATFDTTSTTFTYDTSSLGSAPIDVSIRGINRITGVGDAVTGSA